MPRSADPSRPNRACRRWPGIRRGDRQDVAAGAAGRRADPQPLVVEVVVHGRSLPGGERRAEGQDLADLALVESRVEAVAQRRGGPGERVQAARGRDSLQELGCARRGDAGARDQRPVDVRLSTGRGIGEVVDVGRGAGLEHLVLESNVGVVARVTPQVGPFPVRRSRSRSGFDEEHGLRRGGVVQNERVPVVPLKLKTFKPLKAAPPLTRVTEEAALLKLLPKLEIEVT